MRAQRPACRRVVEIVIGILGAGGGIARGQHESALFAGVADQPRRAHVRRGLRSALGFGGEPHRQLVIGQADDVVLADFRLELGVHAAIEILDLVIGDRALLELAHDRGVIGFLPAVRLRDLRRERLHLRADFVEAAPRARHCLARFHVDPDIAQVERVEFFGKARFGPRGGQHRCAGPFAVIRELGFQRG